MAGINRILAVTIIIHVGLFGSTLYLDNSATDTPFYGGAHGFLPSTGDSANAYDRFSGWLAGGGRQDMSDPGELGGIELLGWIVSGPLCGMASAVKFLISAGILNYGLITLIPNEGFGLWFKMIVNLAAAFVHIGILSSLVGFAIRAGVFSNVYLMVGIGLISAFGIVATLLNAGGAFSCG